MKRNANQKGKVLRFKSGYNPNSSSVGSQIPNFFVFAVSSGILTVIVLQMLNVIGTRIKRKKDAITDLPE